MIELFFFFSSCLGCLQNVNRFICSSVLKKKIHKLESEFSFVLIHCSMSLYYYVKILLKNNKSKLKTNITINNPGILFSAPAIVKSSRCSAPGSFFLWVRDGCSSTFFVIVLFRHTPPNACQLSSDSSSASLSHVKKAVTDLSATPLPCCSAGSLLDSHL